MKSKLLIASLFFLMPGLSPAQTYDLRFDRISVNEGLSQSAVYDILQDSTGYMWFATADGLNRFDGYEFVHYKYRSNDTHSIPDNFVNCLYADQQRNLWIGTYGGGLTRYNPLSENFTHYRKEPGCENCLANNNVFTIAGDKEGNIWIGTNHGLSRLDAVTGNIRNYLPEGVKSYSIFSILQDEKGYLWIGTDRGVNIFYPEKETFAHILQETDSLYEADPVNCIYRDKDHGLWFGSSKGLQFYDPVTSTFRQYLHEPEDPSSLCNNDIQEIYQDDQNRIWIATDGGLSMFDKKKQRFFNYYHDPADPRSLSSNNLDAVFQDRSGVIWVGTSNSGLSKMDWRQNQFDLYQSRPGDKKGLRDNSIFALLEDTGHNIYVGMEGGGLNKIVQERDSSGRIISEKFIWYRADAKKSGSLNSDKIRGLALDTSGNIWVATLGGGLNKFDPETEQFKSYQSTQGLKHTISSNFLYSVLVDKQGIVWAGTDDGLCRFDPRTEKFRSLRVDTANFRSFSSNSVFAIKEDSKGRLWFGTFGGGLALYDKEHHTIAKHYRNDIHDPFSLSNDKVMTIFEDSKNRLWVGTFGGGLNYFDPETGRFFSLSEAEGLPNDVVYGILEDSQGAFWISTNRGISRFEVPGTIFSYGGTWNQRFKNFDHSDDLQSNEFNQGAYLKADDGRMYFGGINGLNAFYPDRIKMNAYVPEIGVAMFRQLAIPLPYEQKLRQYEEMVLDYKSNFISFEFTAFNYINPGKNEFAYKLEGLNDQWIYSGTHRFVSFTNLDPGEYMLHVRASNNDGVWNAAGKKIPFTIASPFWLAWWFLPLVLVLSFVFLGYVFYLVLRNFRQRSRSQVMESKLKAAWAEGESVKARLASLRAQMNPHFIFNSLTSIQHYIANNDPEAARNYLTKFSSLMRKILNNSNQDYITLEEELETLKLYVELEALRFEDKFEYLVEMDPEIDPENMEVPALLLQPYVENAIKHGLINREGRGYLKVILKKENEWIRCIIEDNGIGREKAQMIKASKQLQYKSLGMQMTQNRLEILHELGDKHVFKITDLKDDKGNPAGTRVEILIPLESSLVY
ncbi:MAG: two-component regulator propeller domain-containing protein [Bacteroidia bacterium]